MNINITKTNITIDNNYILNDKEYNINTCYFTFSEEYTDDLVKEAIFVQGTNSIKMAIINNQCQIPYEVLNKGTFQLRVYAYEVDNEELVLRYSPSYAVANVRTGSYIDGANSSQEITPTEFEQYMQALNDGLNEVSNVDIDATKTGNVATITITNRNDEEKIVQISDGETGPQGPIGPAGPSGYSPIANVSKTGNTATITITDKNGTTTAIVSDGINGNPGRDGYVQYTAGDNITIENNVISSTASGGEDNNILVLKLDDDSAEAKAKASKMITANYGKGLLGAISNVSNPALLHNDISSKLTSYTFAYNSPNVYFGGSKQRTRYWFRVDGTWDGDVFNCSALVYYYNGNVDLDYRVLTVDNTYSYNPTANSYNPATTKYVDDAISSAITDALGGSY